MKNIVEILSAFFSLALEKSLPELATVKPPIVPIPSNNKKFGDYQCNIALTIANVRGCMLYIRLFFTFASSDFYTDYFRF